MTTAITPPPELVEQWYNASSHANEKALQDVATAAAQWGADQELEACCKWLAARDLRSQSVAPCLLRIARRPKPPNLKKQALDELTSAERLYPADWSTIRRALEALPE